jgi:PhnB protein
MPGAPQTHGDGVFICLQYEGRADVDRHFAALAEGGTVAEPLQDAVWGARFGLLVDRFGVHWMFNAMLNE